MNRNTPNQKFTGNITVVFEAETYSAAQQYLLNALGSNPTADIQKVDLYRWAQPGGAPMPSPEFQVNSQESANTTALAAARLSLAATAYLTAGSGETVDNRGIKYQVVRTSHEQYGKGWQAIIEASDGFPVNQLAMRAQRSGGIDVTIPFAEVEGKFVADLVPAIMTPTDQEWQMQIWFEGISVDNWTLSTETISTRRVAYRMTGAQGEAIAGGGSEVL